jgi:hypothetical protein
MAHSESHQVIGYTIIGAADGDHGLGLCRSLQLEAKRDECAGK